jgi:hypothetical protein
MINSLEGFLEEAVGNKYGLSPKKLLIQRNTIKPKNGKYIDDDRTFFCSELVAKAYKVLGIIDNDSKACSSYYPSSFSSENKQLKFLPGVSLGPE